MPIPDERLPEIDETIEDPASEVESAGPDMLVDEDEHELESAEADFAGDESDEAEAEEAAERDTAGFGFGDPAD